MPLSDYDKKVIEAGYNYIPRTEFLLNPFKIPENESVTTTDKAGISTLIPRDSSDGSNPYNTNMSTVRQDFNPYEARQAAEIYSRTFNPRSFDPSGEIKNAQFMYNKALQDINDPRPDARGLNARTETLTGMRPSQEVLDYYGEKILDNQERYRTEGQDVDPYDPRYSSMTEAQKFMDNDPEYYGVPSGVPETGIPAAIGSYMQNSLIGKGLGAAKGFVENVLPFNERAALENQARAAGIFTDDIGRIVTNDYNTAGGIMAGYNLNKIDADTFDKRRNTIMEGLMKTNPELARQRLELLDQAEEEILEARKRTGLVSKLRKDKKVADLAIKKQRDLELAAKRKRDMQAKIAAEEARKATAAAEKAYQERVSREAQTADRARAQNQSVYKSADRQGFTNRDGGFSTSRADRAGTSEGSGQFSSRSGRGRTGYLSGGLADMLEIYD